MELLQTSENNLTNQKYLTAAEVKAIKAMNLDEVKEKRAEFLKLKALEKYQEAKFKRVKSIKSKRYRKIARKEREKKHKLDWWEKPAEPQFQVNQPQRPHPSQVSLNKIYEVNTQSFEIRTL